MRLFLFLFLVKGVKTKVSQKRSQKLLKKATYFSSDSKLWTRRSWTSSSSLIPAGDNLLLVPEIRENFKSNLSVHGTSILYNYNKVPIKKHQI